MPEKRLVSCVTTRIKLTLAVCLLYVVASSSVSVAATPAFPNDSLSDASTPSAPGYFAPYPGGDVTPMAESGNITAGSCTYRQAIDNPHISSSAPLAASVHGYWKSISGTCPSTANVDTYLQAYWCDPFGCRWTGVASDSGNIRPGGGSGRRVTARRTCSSGSRTVGWRGYVDVDLNGVGDPAGYTYSPPVNLGCVP
jgi:hypothetical protein